MTAVAGMDSSFDIPPDGALLAARADGVGLWGLYLPLPGAGAQGWTPGDVARIRGSGMTPLAYAFPRADPVVAVTMAHEWGLRRLALDNGIGDTADPFAPGIGDWMATARRAADPLGVDVGMYGQPTVLDHWRGRFAFAVAALPAEIDPGTNDPHLGLGVPTGWQWSQDKVRYWLSVDLGWYDPWFVMEDPMVLPAGFWEGVAAALECAVLGRTREHDTVPGSNPPESYTGALANRLLADDGGHLIDEVHGLLASDEYVSREKVIAAVVTAGGIQPGPGPDLATVLRAVGGAIEAAAGT